VVTAPTASGSGQASDYRQKREPADVRCFYVINPKSRHGNWALGTIVRPAFLTLAAEYGLSASSLRFGEVPSPESGLITYVLYGPTDPLSMTRIEMEYLARLAASGARTNIISAYELSPDGADEPDYWRAAHLVPKLCDDLGINALYPDEIDRRRNIRTNTWQDVYTNVIGETIRIKYSPVQSLNRKDLATRDSLCEEHAEDIAELARLHHEYRLWQRKPWTDGSVVFAHDDLWLASQTVTDKTAMTSEDFDLIVAHNEHQNTLMYAGPRLPTSDAPEYVILSTLLGLHGARPRLMVHFHHRSLTRGRRFPELLTDTTIECGQFAAGRRFFDELRSRGTNWFIIREHGMVWTGDSPAAFEQFCRDVLT
jgi:hypothetical protein